MHRIRHLHQKFMTPIRDFLNDSRAVGVVLIVCTVVSLLLSNLSDTQAAYLGLWQKELHLPLTGALHLPDSYLHWINDVLMTFFFFLVGMEIKRELAIGELASIRKSLLPILAALGGMVCPAIIFSLFNGQTPFHHGWGIPMATDIAFSLGILSLLGNRIPVQLKIFLAALAIIDDLGAVVTVAIFYTSQLNLLYLLIGAGVLAIVGALNLLKAQRLVFYLIPGAVLWYCIFNSGVHATIAGVLMAFSLPLSKLSKLEHRLHYPVNFVIMPLFALANTAVVFPDKLGHIFTSTISFGIIAGLVLGKPLGIFLFSFIATKLGVASLPSRTNYQQLAGIGIIGGIGFTMSIFTATLAYSEQTLQVISKVSIISGSVMAGLIGYSYLYRFKPAVHPLSTPPAGKKIVPKETDEPAAMNEEVVMA